MNEWQLQRALTERWHADGVSVSHERQFLVAWEVMTPSWRINDAGRYWSEPSIDFLVANADGVLTAIELKTSIRGLKPAWRVLCQVTHRAALLRRTFSRENLERAHGDAHSGSHGRVIGRSGELLGEAHRRFFGLEKPLVFDGEVVRRVVAATSFGPHFEQILDEFNALTPARLQGELEGRGFLKDSLSNREPRRLVQTAPVAGELRPPVTMLTVPRP